jgi:hypothetical protein
MDNWWNKADVVMAFFYFCRTFSAYAQFAAYGEEAFIITFNDEVPGDPPADWLPELYEKSVLTDEMFSGTLSIKQ